MATQTIKRNPGIPLDMGWVRATTVNLSATERRAATLGTRRSVKKRVAGGLAAAGDYDDRPDHAGRR